MDIFKFDITKSDMAALEKLDRNKQYTSFSALSYVSFLCGDLVIESKARKINSCFNILDYRNG